MSQNIINYVLLILKILGIFYYYLMGIYFYLILVNIDQIVTPQITTEFLQSKLSPNYFIMKFLSWLGTILIIAAIVAAFTAPGDKQFADFINKTKGGDTMSCKPIISNGSVAKIFSVRLFSFNNVNYCELNVNAGKRIPLRIAGQANNADSSKTGLGKLYLPKLTRHESYLGLFGKFWKYK